MSLKLLKKETLAQVFSCEFCEISKNTFFTEHLWTTASINWTMTRNQVFIKANNPISTKFAVKRTRRRRNFSIAKFFSLMAKNRNCYSNFYIRKYSVSHGNALSLRHFCSSTIFEQLSSIIHNWFFNSPWFSHR